MERSDVTSVISITPVESSETNRRLVASVISSFAVDQSAVAAVPTPFIGNAGAVKIGFIGTASEPRARHHDKLPPTGDTDAMNDITRDELNAKLETIEVKMDARAESVSLKIDGFLTAQSERDKRLDAVLAQIGKDHSETKNSIGSMKTTLIVTALSTVIAIVLGVAGFNTALTSNMLSAFQAGRSDSSSAAAANNSTAPKPQSPTSAK
jgi:hypothetical protein